MAAVLSVEAKGEKAAILVMDDGSRVWTPEKAKADELVGKPIPADWTQKVGDYGPQAFPPRAGKGGGPGGAAAWRNTKEGAWFEAVARAVNTAVIKSANKDEFDEWLSLSIMNLRQLTALDLSNRPATPTIPSSSQPGGGSPAKPYLPSASGANRPSGGGGPAEGYGKGPQPQPPAPTGQKRSDDDNPWAGMPEFS